MSAERTVVVTDADGRDTTHRAAAFFVDQGVLVLVDGDSNSVALVAAGCWTRAVDEQTVTKRGAA